MKVHYRDFLSSLCELHDLVKLESAIKDEPKAKYLKTKLSLIKNIYKFLLSEYKGLNSNLKKILKQYEKHQEDDEISSIVREFTKKARAKRGSLFELKLYSNSFDNILNQVVDIEKHENRQRLSISNKACMKLYKEYMIHLRSLNDLLFAVNDIGKSLIHMNKSISEIKFHERISAIKHNLLVIENNLMSNKLKLAMI